MASNGGIIRSNPFTSAMNQLKVNLMSIFATKKEAGLDHQIQRNTAYEAGDILTSPNLPPGYILVVTTAGTTGNGEPDWDTIRKNMGGVTADGTAAFYINDTLSKHGLGDIVLKPLDKVREHEYLLPLDGQKIDGTKYKRLADYLGTTTLPDLNGRYMRADKTPGQMIEAGLPNITGVAYAFRWWGAKPSGAFSKTRVLTKPEGSCQFRNDSGYNMGTPESNEPVIFDASSSNPIYGNSDTVTPLTYTVRAYIAYA